jgi:hypothetical protein
MAAYAEKGLEAMDQAQRLSEDYFVLDRDAFLRRWLPGAGHGNPAADDRHVMAHDCRCARQPGAGRDRAR